MNSFGMSDKGKYRAENQDSFAICEIGGGVLAVVCDGMGGAAAGYLASEMASARFISFARMAMEASGDDDVGQLLRQAADAANSRVYNFSCQSEQYAGMGTTLVGGLFAQDRVVLVNIGDSRAYRVARDGIAQLTKDHSLVQEMVDRGELTAEQARRHPRRNIITRAVGTEPLVLSDVFTLSVRGGDLFVLCSDGLTNAIEQAELHRLVLAARGTQSACQSLVQAALDNGARDNVTAIVIDPTGGGVQVEA